MRRVGFELVREQDLPGMRRLEEWIKDIESRVDSLYHTTAPRFSAACFDVPGSSMRCYSCLKHATYCSCPKCCGIVSKESSGISMGLCGGCQVQGCRPQRENDA